MKNLLFIIFSILFINIIHGQNKHTNNILLTGQVKVIINDIDTIYATDKPLLVIDRELNYDMVDSIGFFKIAVSKKNKHSLRIIGWGYKIESIIDSDKQSTHNLVLYGNVDCKVDQFVAEKDIQNNNIRLITIGGVVPIANTYLDNDFERKYKLKYFDYGDTPPFFDCVKKYNEVIFKFLDAKYGIQWRVNVRRDVEGL